MFLKYINLELLKKMYLWFILIKFNCRNNRKINFIIKKKLNKNFFLI